jgi:hypothetical protein
MASNLGIIALKVAPDIDALNRLGWIKAFRVYRKASGAEWYIEAPNAHGEGISFFSPLRLNWWWSFGEASARAAKEVFRLRAAINAVSDDAESLDGRFLMHALKLSVDLKTDVLAGFADDEGMDGGFVCSGGRIIGGRLLTEGRKRLIPDANGGCSVEPLDMSEGRLYNGIVSEAATKFFGYGEPIYLSSAPYDFNSADYPLIASRG